MSYIRPVAVTTPNDAWTSLVASETNNNNIVAGSGVIIKKGTGGTVVSVGNQLDKIALNYVGCWNFNQSYQPNDVVYVDPNKNYTDQNGGFLPVCSGSAASGQPPLCAGLFVCTRYVPPLGYDANMLTTYVAPAYASASQQITGVVADTFRQYSFNCYWPIYPVIPSSYITTATQSTWTVTANINFWAPLSPMFISQTCNISGQVQTAYINGVVSGSVFNPSQIPYV